MSVMNQALHAIDQQQAQPGSAASAMPGAKAKAGGSQRRLMVIVLAGGAAIAAVAAGDLNVLKGLTGSAMPPTQQMQPAAVTAAVATAEASPAAAASVAAAEPAPTAAAPAKPTATTAATASPSSTDWPSRSTPNARPAAGATLANAAPAAPAAIAPPAARSPAPELHALATLNIPVPVATPARIDRRASPAAAPPAAATPAARSAALWAKAVEQTNAGQRQAALVSLTELLGAEPTHESARHLAAVLEHEAGNAERAVALLSAGLATDPRQPKLAMLLARLQTAQGQGDSALATLDRAGADSADADGLRAGILSQRGQFREALPAYERALRRQPGNATWWAGLGVALESLSQPEPARQAYVKARTLGVAREELASYVDQRLRALE